MQDDDFLRSLVTAETPLTPASLKRLIRDYRVPGVSESELLEFKATFQGGTHQWVSVLREMVGFSNTEGGIIIFGVGADGELLGCPPRALQRLDPAVVQNKLRNYSLGSKLDVNTTSVQYYHNLPCSPSESFCLPRKYGECSSLTFVRREVGKDSST